MRTKKVLSVLVRMRETEPTKYVFEFSIAFTEHGSIIISFYIVDPPRPIL